MADPYKRKQTINGIDYTDAGNKVTNPVASPVVKPNVMVTDSGTGNKNLAVTAANTATQQTKPTTATTPTYTAPAQPTYAAPAQSSYAASAVTVPNTFEYGKYSPTQYTSQYTDLINAARDKIMNRADFSYNYEEDPMYQQYAGAYTNLGQQAMEDTLARASAQTGGMASSYAESAGQQAYNQYMTALAAKIPELQQLAYGMYEDEGNELYNKLNLLIDADNTDYSRWYNDEANRYSRWKDEQDYAFNNWQIQQAALEKAQAQALAAARAYGGGSGSGSGGNDSGNDGKNNDKPGSTKMTADDISKILDQQYRQGTGANGQSMTGMAAKQYFLNAINDAYNDSEITMSKKERDELYKKFNNYSY